MFKFTKRNLVAAAIVAVGAIGGLVNNASADTYPSKPITMYVGYKAGGQTDLVARAAAKAMSDHLGQPINVVNKPGAGGVVAAYEMKKSDPDGYTLLFHATSVLNAAPFLMKRATFKPEEFEYAGMLTAYQAALATQKDAPFNTVAEYVEWAKQNPGSKFGALNPIARMYIETIATKNDLDVNILPLKGGGDMLNALLGKQVDLVLSGGIHYKFPDKTKSIAALTTFKHPSAPEVETITEAGYPLAMDIRTVAVLPKGTPKPVLEKLSAALATAKDNAEFKKITEAAFIPIMFLDHDAAREEIINSHKNNQAIFESAGIQPK